MGPWRRAQLGVVLCLPLSCVVAVPSGDRRIGMPGEITPGDASTPGFDRERTAFASDEASSRSPRNGIPRLIAGDQDPKPRRLLRGVVRNGAGERIEGASVRVQATLLQASTDGRGAFQLALPDLRAPIRVTAWADGYFVGGVAVADDEDGIEITLRKVGHTDDPAYQWIPPRADRSRPRELLTRIALESAARLSFRRALLPLAGKLRIGCRDCHGRTIYDQWSASAHAEGTRNVRFMTMYNGTDVRGRRSAPAVDLYHKDYGRLRVPDLRAPYYGPGFKLDMPHMEGNCATCHLPGAAIDAPFRTDPNAVSSVNQAGTHCDFCHKIAAVRLDPETGRPLENLTGAMSLQLLRPPSSEQIFFGPYDDVDAGVDAYLPLMKQSEICAPCHDAHFWGTPIYESFAEWKNSDYARRGVTCQSCHMKPDGAMANFAPGRGGIERDPATLASHRFPGARSEKLLRDALALEVAARRAANGILVVSVTVANRNTGHHVPTDSPLRHVILVITATDETGRRLPQLQGPKVPDWCGTGAIGEGNYGGRAGKAFAKVLAEIWTNRRPSGAYWNPTRIVSDNRIAALASDASEYAFEAAATRRIDLEVVLLYRRAYKELMEQKGWDEPDIVMARHRSSFDPMAAESFNPGSETGENP